MRVSFLFIAMLVCCAAWAVVTTIRVYGYLRERNIPVSFLWLRLMIIKYLGQYKQISSKETGKVGPLFYHYLISANGALLAVIAAALAVMAERYPG
jgi:hypothetical protein